MKVQIIFTLHLTLLLFVSVNCINYKYDDQHIYRNLYVQKKYCGSVMTSIMRELCNKYNGYRTKRNIHTDCCKRPCTYHYMMMHYCEEPRLALDSLPSFNSWVMTTSTDAPVTKRVPADKTSNPGQEHLQNKIQRQPPPVQHPVFGVISSTLRPNIYRHSNTNGRGTTIYNNTNK